MVSLLSMFQRPPSSNAKANLQEFNKRIPSYPFMKYFKIYNNGVLLERESIESVVAGF